MPRTPHHAHVARARAEAFRDHRGRIDHEDRMMDDYGSMPSRDSVRIERDLPGPIERLWSHLVDPDKRARWLADGPMDQRVGGSVDLVFHNNALTDDDTPAPAHHAAHAEEATLHGRVTACDPPRLLAFTWGDGAEPSDVTFELTPRGERVHLVVTHRRLASRDDKVSVAAGWHTHLGVLAARLEAREPEGFWSRFTQLEADYGARIG